MILTRRKLTWRKLTRIESFLFPNQMKLTRFAMKLCKSNEINANRANFLIFSKFSRRRQLIHREKTTCPSPENCLNFLLFSIVKDNNTLLYSIVNFEKIQSRNKNTLRTWFGLAIMWHNIFCICIHQYLL